MIETVDPTSAADRRLLMLGSGGHARVLQELLGIQGKSVSGYLAPTSGDGLPGVAWLGTDEALAETDQSAVWLINGIGSVRAGGPRLTVYETTTALGFEFLTIIDPTAIVRSSVTLGHGVQVLAGVIVNSGAAVGANTILNSGAIVEHDSFIGSDVHVSPGAVLGGGVRIGNGTHIGLGARVLHGVSIGSHCTIGAGAVVTKDIGDGVIAVGIPAIARATTAAD